jgi:hypothetical protein
MLEEEIITYPYTLRDPRPLVTEKEPEWVIGLLTEGDVSYRSML